MGIIIAVTYLTCPTSQTSFQAMNMSVDLWAPSLLANSREGSSYYPHFINGRTQAEGLSHLSKVAGKQLVELRIRPRNSEARAGSQGYTRNPSYSRGRDQVDHGFKVTLGKNFDRHHLNQQAWPDDACLLSQLCGRHRGTIA
jgi:hypothetical protein